MEAVNPDGPEPRTITSYTINHFTTKLYKLHESDIFSLINYDFYVLKTNEEASWYPLLVFKKKTIV